MEQTKTISSNGDPVAGFEFLLDKDLLFRHLSHPKPDPPPTELITKFYEIIACTIRNRLEPDEGFQPDSCEPRLRHPAKTIALKILALKTAAHLSWNLSQIRSLPFKTQISLLQDLIYYTSGEKVTYLDWASVENLVEIDGKSPQFVFSLLLLHRWVLNTSMHRVTSSWQQRYGPNELSLNDENIICSTENVQKCIDSLTAALNWTEPPFMITFDCFKMPTEENDSIYFQWTHGLSISREEFCAQICYDLGTYFFYRENYTVAKQHFNNCQRYVQAVITQLGYATFSDKQLDVYVKACDPTLDVPEKSLLEQLNHSIVNQYVGITNVLQLDNVRRQIPLPHRLTLELDIQGAVSSGVFTVARDLLIKIKALNYLRCVLDRKLLTEFSLKLSKHVDTLIWTVESSWTEFPLTDRNIIKRHLVELTVKDPKLIEKFRNLMIFDNVRDADLAFMVKQEHQSNIDNLDLFSLDKPFVESSRKKKPKLEYRQVAKQLLSATDWRIIKELIGKLSNLAGANDFSSITNLNPHWNLPIPLQSVLKSLPRGTVANAQAHDFAYILLAKSRDQYLARNFTQARHLLTGLEQELLIDVKTVTSCHQKLSQLIKWELLLIDIAQLMDSTLSRCNFDKLSLASQCEQCLQTTETVLPRTEIAEACALCLLTMGRFEFLIGYETRRGWNFDIVTAIALACHEIIKSKLTKKLSKDLWDLTLPVLAGAFSQSKQRYNDSTQMKANLMSIFLNLKDIRCLTVVISMLSKLYNIFKDEANLELQAEGANLWPNSVSNASSYNVNLTSEMLTEVLKQALKDYPCNIPWLRLMGDCCFANGNYRTSLSYYLKSLIICNDYFNIPIRSDDHVFRRMIKCCQALGCHTQAAVLCQFLDEPDYALAFRILGETTSKSGSNDAVDAYYHCFWDTTILEYLIHIHHRRGEFQRTKVAGQVMGMLELNSSNNEEIQREASNLRKSVFLRALCKQYVFFK